MAIITSMQGSRVGHITDHPYWAVKLSGDKWICELDQVYDHRIASLRPVDWTLDLVSTGDVLKIKELWLFCPATPRDPQGTTARLPIIETGTAFQMKMETLASGHQITHNIIGRVTDKATGDCEYFVYDGLYHGMSMPLKNNIHAFQAWRDGVLPLGSLNAEVLGLRL